MDTRNRRAPPAVRADLRRWVTQGTHLPAVRESPDAVRRLTGLATDARAAALLAVLTGTLDTALAITGTDLGFAQLVDVATGALVVVAGSGFRPEVIRYFDAVGNEDTSSCGRALRTRTQAVIRDVDLDTGFRPHRAVAASAGFRAVQSTPLIGSDGGVAGVASTHFHRPHQPSDQQLRALRSCGRLAGAALAPLLDGRRDGDRSGELAELRATVAQLEHALSSRIVIEQAKGVISVTNRVDVDRAFELLRGHARSHHLRIHDVAAAVVRGDLRL